MWGPEENIGCYFSGTFNLIFWDNFSYWPGTHSLGSASCPASFRVLLSLPFKGWNHSRGYLVPLCFMGSGDWTQVILIYTAKAFTMVPVPRLAFLSEPQDWLNLQKLCPWPNFYQGPLNLVLATNAARLLLTSKNNLFPTISSWISQTASSDQWPVFSSLLVFICIWIWIHSHLLE